jgi:hypothetical protein
VYFPEVGFISCEKLIEKDKRPIANTNLYIENYYLLNLIKIVSEMGANIDTFYL